MANIKRNKVAGRCIVVAGTLLAGLGIWASVANYPLVPQSAAGIADMVYAQNGINSTSLSNETLVMPPTLQTGPAVVPQPSPAQPEPIGPAPALSPTTSPQPRPVITPAPRLRTRGS
jgi:hypothetical protein